MTGLRYPNSNYCCGCKKQCPKICLRCPICGYKVRSKGRQPMCKARRELEIVRY